jgi:hypothetical protein
VAPHSHSGGGVHHQRGGLRCSGLANEHRVHGTFVLFPVGTLDHGTPHHDSVGTVQTPHVAHGALACGRGGIHPPPCRAGDECRWEVSEVIIAPLLEITFIASFTNRFFAR